MQVVIVPNALAPVVTVEMNFQVGGEETPPGFPGMAHAQEHMAFRGCAGMSADQTAAVYAEMGGQNNADTQQNDHPVFRYRPGFRSGGRAEGAGRVSRGHRGLADRMGTGARRDRAGSRSRPVQPHLQVSDPVEPGYVRRHPVCPRRPRHQALLRRHHRRDAQSLLPHLVRSAGRDPGHRRRRGTASHAREGAPPVRRHSGTSAAAAAGREH